MEPLLGFGPAPFWSKESMCVGGAEAVREEAFCLSLDEVI